MYKVSYFKIITKYLFKKRYRYYNDLNSEYKQFHNVNLNKFIKTFTLEYNYRLRNE